MTTTITASELGRQIRREIMDELRKVQRSTINAKAREDHERELFDSLQSLQDVR